MRIVNVEKPMDARLTALSAWVRGALAQPDLRIEVASADASFRRYFRATANGRTWIVMDAPPDKEDVGPYIKVAEMICAAGVNAPRVLARHAEGFLLLTDLGNCTYLAALADPGDAERLYGDALGALLRMQTACVADALPAYDAPLLRREMELFPEWFLQRHLAIAVDDGLREQLDAQFQLLIDAALAQPRVFVHRDYHSRNLMVTQGPLGPNPGVLDFQDAVSGPITYDLVSLLRDCYIAWPLARVRQWALAYRQSAREAGLIADVDETTWLQWFDLMGMQRHLKAIGIFARLWHRDGKGGYLGDIPRTLGYVRAVAANDSRFGALVELIDKRIAPALERKAASA